MATGNQIFKFRKTHRMSRERFGQYMGVSGRTIARYEAGEIIPATQQMLFGKLAQYVDANKAVPTIEGWTE